MESLLDKLFNSYPYTTITITVFVAVITGLWQYRRYINEWNFRNYHQLIKDLTEPEPPKKVMRLDRQIAIAYELRNYPRYFPVSKRILKIWIEDASKPEHLRDEMWESVEYMNRCFIARSCVRWWTRLF